jgi:hypothetical protein
LNDRVLPGSFLWCFQVQCLVNPVVVVVILNLPHFLFQVAFVQEKSLIQSFPSDGADKPFGEGMGYRSMGNSLDLRDFPNSQIGSPAVVSEQGNVVRTEIMRFSLCECGLIEHPAKRGAIDIASMHPKSNDSPGELIHDENDPVGFKHDGLAPEQINAREAVLQMADEGEPGRSIPWVHPKMFGEDTSYDVLIDIDAKGPGNLLRDLGTAEPRLRCFISKMS